MGAVCGLTALTALTACSQPPSRTATGEEIGAAVEQAERELAEVRAKQPSQSTESPFTSALPL